jgi:hypothetical protein
MDEPAPLPIIHRLIESEERCLDSRMSETHPLEGENAIIVKDHAWDTG